MKDEKLLTADDVSVILNIPVSTVYYYATHKLIPSVKFGRQRRFRKSEILKWLKAQEKASAAQQA